jgi:ADP-heptose:LPS heptosyltransferase
MGTQTLKKRWCLYGHGLWNILKSQADTQENHLLVIQLSSLGDACTLIPACVHAKQRGYDVDIVCRPGLQDLWSWFLPSCEVVTYAGDVWSVAEAREALSPISPRCYDAVFITTMRPIAVFVSTYAKSGKRYGMIENGRHYKGVRLLLTRVYNAAPNEHVTSRYDNLFALHIPEFASGGIHMDPAHTKSGGPVIIHPGAKWRPRRWPAANYLELAHYIAQEGRPVELIVHRDEEDLCSYFTEHATDELVTIHEVNDVRRLIDVITACSLFIGNDSGPMQLANLLGKPTVVLWGPGNLHRIGPRGRDSTVIMKEIGCRPCRQYVHSDHCERGENVCLRQITVNEVKHVVRDKMRSFNEAIAP